MTPSDLDDIVFVVYVDDGSELDDHESPVLGVRRDLHAALQLGIERLLRDEVAADEVQVTALGPYHGGRITWLAETESWSVYVETATLSGAPISPETSAWLMTQALQEHGQA